MKMSKPGLCCDDCFSLIAKRNSAAARIWLYLCEIQETCALFGIEMDDTPEFNILERLGFITTTDLNKHIVIKVHGRHRDSLGNFFCGGHCGRE